jgi:hypothetical protein
MLYCYLVIKTLREIQLERLFKEYKTWLTGKSAEEKVGFLRELKQYAEIYASFPSETDLNQIAFCEVEKRFFHVVESLTVTTIYPLVLDAYRTVADAQSRVDILRTLESYLVRRNVCRLTTKNYNLLFIQIIREIRNRNVQLTPQLLQQILSDFTDPTNRMPDDAEFARAFRQEVLSNQNAREILFLIALFDVSTGRADIPSLSVRNYSVEHMMPVKWELNWTEREMTRDEKAERNSKLRTLGNLTLVTGRLNSAMKNAGWDDKKLHLRPNSSLKMTIEYLDGEEWNEAGIEKRAQDLTTRALLIWKDIPRETAVKA